MLPPPKKVKTKKISRLPLFYVMESESVSKIITARCRFFREYLRAIFEIYFI